MPARNEISYYLIQHPLKETKTIAYDRYELSHALNEFDEGMKIKRVLHIPDRGVGQEKMIFSFEDSLADACMKESQRLRGWKHFLRIGIGGALTYLTYPTLFSLGMGVPFQIFGPWRGPIPTEIQIGSYILGAAAAIIPYAYIRGRTHKFSVIGSELNRYGRLIRDIKENEFRIIEDKNLIAFQKACRRIAEGTRSNAKKIQTTERFARLTACISLQKGFDELFRQAKIHQLIGLDEYYHRLYASFYNLQKKLEKPRFWRNDERYVKKVFESLSETLPLTTVQ